MRLARVEATPLNIPVVLDANGLFLMSGAFDVTRLPPALR